LFLVGFFINIGLSGDPSINNFILGGLLAIFMVVKVILFFWLLNKTRLRSRTSFLCSLSLANYSEFGLIVGAIGVNNGWMSNEWLITIAIALAITFIISAPLNTAAHKLYSRYATSLRHWQTKQRLKDEQPVNIRGSSLLVFGMGRIGLGVYKDLNLFYPKQITGIDFHAQLHIEHIRKKKKSNLR